MSDQTDVIRRALEAIDTLSARLAESEGRLREPIAVVGMACRFPGGVTTPAQYWSLLRDGRSGIVEIPADRWDVDAWYDPDPAAEGKMYTRHGGFLENIDGFDAPFFGIAGREALTLDPQHRLLLECAWEALEDAGEAPERLPNTQTGVYIGITTSDYARLLRESGDENDVYSASGTALNAAAGRISFILGLQGPSMAVDTACSSSLVAAHLATQALRAGECDMALVGGVNVIASPDPYVLFSRWGMIAPGAECRTFDAGANGFVRGEGCGVLVLKRLRDAVADGNRVLAVIRGTAVNQDGPSSGLSVPNGLAQAKVIRRALENAGLTPADVDFVEAHGTGTVLGDPIEVEALGEVYGRDRGGRGPLMLGSVKPSIGHLESAAGVAGLMKLVLTVRHGELPPQRNFAEPNPRIDWEDLPIEVVRERREWPTGRTVRVGAVSGFGFSGTNAHIVVASVEEGGRAGGRGGEGAKGDGRNGQLPRLIPLSARTEPALREAATRLAGALAAGDDAPALADVARTMSLGRSHLAYRAAVVGSDRDAVRVSLDAFARGEPAAHLVTGHSPERTPPRVAFLFTGQGSQYPRMGLELRDTFPVFREAFDRCDAILGAHGGPRLLEILSDPGRVESVHETAVTQPAVFALEYALTELFRSWGIEPSAVLGHSVGEFTAACVAGILPLEDALVLIAERGRLMQSLPAGGGMLAVAADAATALDAASLWAASVSLAALNGPRDVVLSGDLQALDEISAALKSAGIDTKPLKVSHAFHSPLMEPILEPFARAASRVTTSAPRIPLVSNVTGMVDPDACASAEYWRKHLRAPVAYEASVRHLVDQGFRVFLEIGPRAVLSGMARRFITSEDVTWAPTLRGREGETADVLEGLGVLYAAGARPDWERVLDGAGRRIPLPTYPFQRRRVWVQPKSGVTAEGSPGIGTGIVAAEIGAVGAPTATNTADEGRPGDHPFLGRRIDSPAGPAHFLCTLDPARRPVLAEHRVAGSILFPAAGYIEIAAAAGRAVLGSPVQLRSGAFRGALVLDDAANAEVQLVVTREPNGSASFEVFSRTAVEVVAGEGAPNAGEWRSHAAGAIVRAVGEIATESAISARDRCADAVDIDAYQARMREVGLEYGPSFRALTSAWRGEREALGELRLPPGDSLVDRVSVHPGLLDAAFHLIGLALPDDGEDRFFLPVGFESVELTGEVGSIATAHALLRVADERQVIADITVWTAGGKPVVRVLGLQARPVTTDQFRAALGGHVRPADGDAAAERTELTRVAWRELPLASSAMAGGSAIATGPDGSAIEIAASGEALSGNSSFEWLLLGGGEPLATDVRGVLRDSDAAVTWLPDPDLDEVVGRVTQAAGRAGILDLRPLARTATDAEAAALTSATLSGEGALPDSPGTATASHSPEHAGDIVANGNVVFDNRLSGVANLAGVEPARAARVTLDPSLALFRRLAVTPVREGVRIVVPTLRAVHAASGDRVDPAAAALWVLAVTAGVEIPGVRLNLIDVAEPDEITAALAAVSDLPRTPGGPSFTDEEPRLAWRGNRLFTPRLVAEAGDETCRLTLPPGGWELVMAERGTLDGLGVEPRARREPGPGEVEIAVLASGLNFRDVLNLLDMYPGPAGPLGNECSGRVVRVGPGVESVQAGDLVTCIAESTFASHVIARAELTFPVPAALSVAQAAAFPIAQLTAWLALHRVGKMRVGDRVLIHAGAGGVGLAAVHLALAAGAEVYASAGSEEKRAWLRGLGVRHVFDSRNPATAEEIRAVVGGDGIDLLLNSLTGAFIDEGIRALAPGGRFLEIGLRELRTDEAIREIRDDVSYHALLLGDLCREDPAAVREMYDALLALLAEGRIPPPRTRTFPAAESPAAWRYMAKARQIGRVAITHPAADQPVARRDASYLVTGGLGALGLHVAEWLAGQGAGRLVLMGRSAPSDEAAPRIAAIETAGTRVEILRGDVADPAALEFFFAGNGIPGADGFPLRGIVHAAGVTEDAALSRVDGDRVERVLRPKANGAAQLARLAEAASVDFLVFFSSASALLGSPGQGAYAAANGWLDGYAERLREEGVPAVSIAWGAWEGSGMVAQVDERTRREWAARGVGTFAVADGVRLLGEAIAAGRARVAAIPIAWPRYLRALGTGETPALLREIAPGAPLSDAEASGVADGDIVLVITEANVPTVAEEIAALPPRERLAALIDRLRRETAAVMGIPRPQDLELALGFMEQGMDSLMSVELSGRIGRLLGVSLPTTFAFEYPTLNALGGHLLAELGLDSAAPAPAVQVETAAPRPDDTDLESMSTDEATRALLDELEEIGY